MEILFSSLETHIYHEVILIKNMIYEIILTVSALGEPFIGYIQLIQVTLHSSGLDWLVWPIFLIAAWWMLLARTAAILKIFALPTIAVSTYFVLFIAYNTMISL